LYRPTGGHLNGFFSANPLARDASPRPHES